MSRGKMTYKHLKSIGKALALLTLFMLVTGSLTLAHASIQGEVGIYGWSAANPNESKKILIEANGGLATNLQDQTSDIVNLYMHRHTGASAILTTDTAINDYVLQVETGHGFNATEMVCFKENERFYQGAILSTTATTITLDSPLDYAYTDSASLTSSVLDLTVNGSPASPLVYHVKPTTGTQWDIVRILFYIEDDSAMDDGKFGGIAALTNGIVLRSKNGTYLNIFNVKTNGDFAQQAFDRNYVAKPPAGTGHSMIVRRTFGGQSKNGVVIRLDGDSGDELELIIRDDLTGLSHFHIVVQGHLVTN